MKRLIAVVIVALNLFSYGTANAVLVGDQVNAAILPGNVNGVVGTQFTSPALVGPGTEFTGNWLFPAFDMNWQVDLDVDASSFEVTVNEIGPGNNNLSDGPQMFGIELTDLDWVGKPGFITDVTQTAGGVGVSSISFTNDSITVFWSEFPFGFGNDPPTGGSWTFDIEASHKVIPEPATAALGLRLRRRRAA